MLMTECHRLFTSDCLLRHVARSGEGRDQPEQSDENEQGAKNTHPRNGIGTWVKDLCHCPIDLRAITSQHMLQTANNATAHDAALFYVMPIILISSMVSKNYAKMSTAQVIPESVVGGTGNTGYW
jgi:hypothetical protein